MKSKLKSGRTLLLTRPEAQSAEFLAALAERMGHVPRHVISPIVEIRNLQVADPGDVQAFLFTSANGVRAFAAQHAPRGRRALCVGDSTAEVAAAAGFAAVSAGGQAEDLLKLARQSLSPDGGPVVHVSGRDVAMDVAAALACDGYDARRIVAYAQERRPLTAPALKCLSETPVVVPVFSPRAARALEHALGDGGTDDMVFACISQRAVPALPGQSHVASSPSREDMLDLVSRLLREPEDP